MNEAAIGSLEVTHPAPGTDLLRATCGGCAKVLGVARTGADAVGALRKQIDKAGAVLLCGDCVHVLGAAVRNPKDPHLHDVAAQRLTAALGCSGLAQARVAGSRI